MCVTMRFHCHAGIVKRAHAVQILYDQKFVRRWRPRECCILWINSFDEFQKIVTDFIRHGISPMRHSQYFAPNSRIMSLSLVLAR